MTTNPDPYVMTIFAKQRHKAFESETERQRLVNLAAGNHDAQQRRRWSERIPIVAAAVALALLTAGTVAVRESSSQPLAALSQAADSITTHLLADEPVTSAVQKVREAVRVETAAAQPTAGADLAKATSKLML